jgi:hypothetical protein
MASIICLRLVGNLKLEKKMKKFNFMMESVIFKMQRQNNNKKRRSNHRRLDVIFLIYFDKIIKFFVDFNLLYFSLNK